MSTEKGRALKPEVMEALIALAPELTNVVIRQLMDRLAISDAAQVDQDKVTTGIWNMPPVPGSNTPPRMPPAEIIVERRKLLALQDWLGERRNYQLSKCKTRKLDVTNGDGTSETVTVIEDPENAQQRKATERIKRIDAAISEIGTVYIKPLSQFALDFRLNPLIDKIIHPGFLGEGTGQKHVGATDEQVERLKHSLEFQGKLKPKKNNSEAK